MVEFKFYIIIRSILHATHLSVVGMDKVYEIPRTELEIALVRNNSNGLNLFCKLYDTEGGPIRGLRHTANLLSDTASVRTYPLVDAHNVDGMLLSDDRPNSAICFTYQAIVEVNFDTGGLCQIAGHESECGYKNGSGRDARFNHVRGIAFRADGVLVVADGQNNAVVLLRLMVRRIP